VKTAHANGTFLATMWKIRRRNLQRGGGDGVSGGLAWLLETKNIVSDDFSKVICHLAVLLTDSFSSLNSGSFNTN
jgi:hypothetical protein